MADFNFTSRRSIRELYVQVKLKLKLKLKLQLKLQLNFTLEEATKAQKGSRGIAVLFP
jgi:hypothetical protein